MHGPFYDIPRSQRPSLTLRRSIRHLMYREMQNENPLSRNPILTLSKYSTRKQLDSQLDFVPENCVDALHPVNFEQGMQEPTRCAHSRYNAAATHGEPRWLPVILADGPHGPVYCAGAWRI